jgi:hypothetical protein
MKKPTTEIIEELREDNLRLLADSARMSFIRNNQIDIIHDDGDPAVGIAPSVQLQKALGKNMQSGVMEYAQLGFGAMLDDVIDAAIIRHTKDGE